VNLHGVHDRLRRLYIHYNRREFTQNDPIQFLYRYEDPQDMETAGLIASGLAFGTVKQILRSVEAVLDRLPRPARFLEEITDNRLRELTSGFHHRFIQGEDLYGLLRGIKGIRERYGSLGRCFLQGFRPPDSTVYPALARFAETWRHELQNSGDFLIPNPGRGSACKRLNLFLRWMVRKDEVDCGVWTGISASKLIVPLDTHMFAISRFLGLTQRKRPDRAAALEVTAAFRCIEPDDPVRYDFALTRLGIRQDTHLLTLP